MKKIKETVAISDDEIRITEFYEKYLHCFVVKLFAEHCFNREGRTEMVHIGLFKKSQVKESAVRDG